MAVTAIALPGATYSAQWWRQAMIGSIYAHAENSITCMPGVVVGMLPTGITGARVIVEPGQCVVSPAHGPRGSYVVASDTTVTLQLAPADSTYSRIDAVAVRVRDHAFDGSGATDAAIVAVTGTPSASPVAPTIPDGTLLLAHVTVPTSGNASAVDRRLWTSAIGGNMGGSQAQRLALSTANLRPGQTFTELDPATLGQTWRWNGTHWTPQFITGFRAYLGFVQREFSFDYTFAVPAGRVIAMPLRRAWGSRWDERNNLDCTVVNGYNIRVPLPGRYRIQYGMATQPDDRDIRFAIAIRTGVVATESDQGTIGTPVGTILAEDRSQGSTTRMTEVQQYQLAAGAHISATVWHNDTVTKSVYYENPFTSFVDITRLGD